MTRECNTNNTFIATKTRQLIPESFSLNGNSHFTTHQEHRAGPGFLCFEWSPWWGIAASEVAMIGHCG